MSNTVRVPVIPTVPSPTRRLLTGAEAVHAVRELERKQQARNDWPYSWLFPPLGAIRVKTTSTQGTIVAPAPTVQATVLTYTVPTGFDFVMTRLIQVYTGAGFVPGSGDITWIIDRNVPLAAPVLLGNPIQGFQTEIVPLGTFEMPWVLDMPEIFTAGDQIRSKVTTTANIAAGIPNYFTSMFLGWLVPAE